MDNLLGQSFSRWTVLAFMGRGRNGTRTWLCRCECGELRDIPQGNLVRNLSKSCGCYRRERMALLGRRSVPLKDTVTYAGAHLRVRAAKGPASSHACADCGGRAAEWSLKHEAPLILEGQTRRGRTCRYSLDIDDYEPRCRKCHYAYDRFTRTDEP